MKKIRKDITMLEFYNGDEICITKEHMVYETEKCFEIWSNRRHILLSRIRKSKILWVGILLPKEKE